MKPTDEIVSAALEVAIERFTQLHPEKQVFIFGASGEPFWAKQPMHDTQLDELKDALTLIEHVAAERARPFAATGKNGRYSVYALDAEGELYAVVLWHASTSPRMSAAASPQSRSVVQAPVGWFRGPQS